MPNFSKSAISLYADADDTPAYRNKSGTATYLSANVILPLTDKYVAVPNLFH
jgi:hypothetical protein